VAKQFFYTMEKVNKQKCKKCVKSYKKAEKHKTSNRPNKNTDILTFSAQVASNQAKIAQVSNVLMTKSMLFSLRKP
jgi:hypothetical protein